MVYIQSYLILMKCLYRHMSTSLNYNYSVIACSLLTQKESKWKESKEEHEINDDEQLYCQVQTAYIFIKLDQNALKEMLVMSGLFFIEI